MSDRMSMEMVAEIASRLLPLPQHSPRVASSLVNGGIASGNGDARPRLDVPRWLSDNGTNPSKVVDKGEWTSYEIQCPFDPSHGARGETTIGQHRDGALSFKCQHDSCSAKGWSDARDTIGKPAANHYDPPLQESRKKKNSAQSSQRDSDGDDWDCKGPEVKRPLYGLADVATAESVFVTNSETSADAIASIGLVAVTSRGGKSPQATDWTALRGKHVVVWPSNDYAGQGHARTVGDVLEDIAREVKILDVSGLPAKSDAYDWVHSFDDNATLDQIRESLLKWIDDTPPEPPSKPQVSLPNGETRITDAAGLLGALLAKGGMHYRRGQTVVMLDPDSNDGLVLVPVKPATLCSEIEEVASIVRKTGDETEPAICSEGTAKLILASNAFARKMPRIRSISNCPLLVGPQGKLRLVIGFDADTGILTQGESPEDVPLDVAVQLLLDVVADFRFTTPSDKSRAVAALVTPALALSSLLRGRAPIDFGEADFSQSGKGFSTKANGCHLQHGDSHGDTA
ncbi:MAG: hypothetical protein R3E01_22470 [Pirellulaceae bacterium]